MDKMIVMCGLVCTECPLFMATQNDDQDEKRRIAERWSTEQHPLDPEEMFCDGCITAGGRKISFCEVCDVRRCRLEMKVDRRSQSVYREFVTTGFLVGQEGAICCGSQNPILAR